MDRPGLNCRPNLFFFLFMVAWTALIIFVFRLKRIRCRFASIDSYWDRPTRSIFWAVLLFSLLGFSSFVWAETAPNTELESILQKIESRHYRWIAIRADVLLFFAKAGDPNALCGGELLYQRLDERMFLTCVDARQELMFVFRTLDRRFDLYLPAQNTVYHGSIFDLEDSPDIESHLKARDLYRALKPMAVDPRRTRVERTNSAITSLDVYGRNDNERILERKLYLTPEGDVRGELFYNSKEQPVTEIQRYDFREFRGQVGSYKSIVFPKKITITSPETQKGSAIFFTRVKALDTIDPLEFILRVPPGTKEVFLDEKDPRFNTRRLKLGEKFVSPSTNSEKDSNAGRRAGLNLPYEAEHPPAIKNKVPEKAASPKPSPEVKSAPESPQDIPAKTSTKTATLDSADADLAIDDKPPSASSSALDAQTTLDPSVDASLEMGKP